jgi:hypothetical protein
MNNIKRQAPVAKVICLLFIAACGGPSDNRTRQQHEYTEAGVAAGIAVTAALIQSARRQAKPIKSASECCAICNNCSFPCGDGCVPIGAVCLKPDGCACYDSQLPIPDRPPQWDQPCLKQTDDGNMDGVMIPAGVEY